MYAQVEKTKENKSRTVANSVSQKKSNTEPSFRIVNKPMSIQRVHESSSLKHGSTIQLKKVETEVVIKSNAVEMINGSIYEGKPYKELQLGEFIEIDDEDKYRSRLNPKEGDPDKARWLRASRIGVVDLADRYVYVWDKSVGEVDETQKVFLDKALMFNKKWGEEVRIKVEKICKDMLIDQKPNVERGSVEHIIQYFVWLEKIGQHLEEIIPDLDESISAGINLMASEPSEDQKNSDTNVGRFLDFKLVEELDKQLRVLSMVLANDASNIIESLATAVNEEQLGTALEKISKEEKKISGTMQEYLGFGLKALHKAMSHREIPNWKEQLKSTIEALNGCYTWQFLKLEHFKPEEKPKGTKGLNKTKNELIKENWLDECVFPINDATELNKNSEVYSNNYIKYVITAVDQESQFLLNPAE